MVPSGLSLEQQLQSVEELGWRPRDSQRSSCTLCKRSSQACFWPYEDESCTECARIGQADCCIALPLLRDRAPKTGRVQRDPSDIWLHDASGVLDSPTSRKSLRQRVELISDMGADGVIRKKLLHTTELNSLVSERNSTTIRSQIACTKQARYTESIHGKETLDESTLVEEYEVERILDGKHAKHFSPKKLTPSVRLGKQKRVEYLVKWHDFDDTSNSVRKGSHRTELRLTIMIVGTSFLLA